MQVSVSLQESFILEIILLIIFLAIILGIAVYFIFSRKYQKALKSTDEYKKISQNDKNKIKEKYLEKLKNLEKKIEEGKISSKMAHFEISSNIRKFAYEMTNIKVQNYTLEEIKSLKNDELSNLMEKCYLAEYPKESIGDAKELITKTRKVIEKWS